MCADKEAKGEADASRSGHLAARSKMSCSSAAETRKDRLCLESAQQYDARRASKGAR